MLLPPQLFILFSLSTLFCMSMYVLSNMHVDVSTNARLSKALQNGIYLCTCRLISRAKRMVASDVRTSVEKPNLMGRPEWSVVKYGDSKAPSDLTVTHVNQTYDLWVCR